MIRIFSKITYYEEKALPLATPLYRSGQNSNQKHLI